jgi:hypothetical protein
VDFIFNLTNLNGTPLKYAAAKKGSQASGAKSTFINGLQLNVWNQQMLNRKGRKERRQGRQAKLSL